MDHKHAKIGFIGAGGIARSHAYSLNSLRYFYNNVPEVELAAVCSARESSREAFASKFGFAGACGIDEFIANDKIDTVFILGPNNVHLEHLRAAAGMHGIKRIYLEKPVCSGPEEEKEIEKLVAANPGIRIQVGFQYLFSASVREALALWKSGIFGTPVHFGLKYITAITLKKSTGKRGQTGLPLLPTEGRWLIWALML
jgi:predicted dehydrogenase